MPACPIPVDESVHQQTQDLVKVDTVLISLIDQERRWFKARVGLDASEATRDVSFRGYAILGEDTQPVRQDSKKFVAPLKVKDGEELQRVAERVLGLIGHEPVQLPCGPLPVSLSIGCTLLAGEAPVDQALEHVDVALYSAKQAGRNRVHFSAPPVSA